MSVRTIWSGMVADIGGTNARFALASPRGTPSEIKTLACADYGSLVEAAEAYLRTVGAQVPRALVFAVATPVLGDEVNFTNNHWSFSIESARATLGCESLTLINDFEALALALPLLANEDLLRLDREASLDAPFGTKVVFGPGTGLGVAGLVSTKMGWHPISTEGGHVSLSPTDDLESALLKHLWRDWPHVSAERLLSGPGIMLIYKSLAALTGKPMLAPDPAAVTGLAANAECALATETLKLFSGLLGGFAGNLALSFGSVGGVYLGGGIIRKLGATFDRERFNQKFIAKGRFEAYLRNVPRWQIVSEYPALYGAASLLSNAPHGST